jgi:hypothetical protein
MTWPNRKHQTYPNFSIHNDSLKPVFGRWHARGRGFESPYLHFVNVLVIEDLQVDPAAQIDQGLI